MPLVGSHQQGAFSTPVNGQPTDASVVLSNDNANRTTTNAHDADATIHIQSSVLASRPAAGTAQRVWITSDGLRFYFDSGSVWNELDYLSKAAGGTVAGAVTLSASLTAAAASFSGAVTMASTLGVSGAIQLADAQQVQWAGSNNAIRFTGTTFQLYPNGVLGFSVAAGGVGVLAGGLTVSSGTTAVQALTATSVGTGALSATSIIGDAGGDFTIDLQRSTVSKGLVGVVGTAGHLINDAAQDDIIVRANGKAIRLSTNSGSSSAVTVAASGATTFAAAVTISAGGLSVTGGITGTLSTAAQPNITSVGVLASTHLTSPTIDSGGLTVTAGDVLISSGVVKSSAQGMFGPNNGSGSVGFLGVSNDTASTATGGASTLPANPSGFLVWKNGTTVIKVPYYNN